MTTMLLSKKTTAELLARFVELTTRQGQAVLMLDTARFNKLYPQVTAIVEELGRRPGDQRYALLELYNHPDAQVRMTAATRTMKLAPDAAMQVLQEIVDAKVAPQAFDAGMTLGLLREGIGKLD
jgi:hypothetical protein